MKLQEGTYKVERTKENLYEVMNEHFALDEKAVVAALKRCGHKQFNVGNWENYIECLTRFTPCKYCGAPRKQPRRAPIGPKYLDGLVCLHNRRHYLLQATEDILALRKGPEAAYRQVRIECEHHDLKMTCDICDGITVAKRFADLDIPV